MEIQPLPKRFFSEAVDLWEAAGLTRPWNDPYDDLDRATAGPSSTVLACLSGDRLLATAMVGHDGHRGWIYYLAVVESARRQGIGTDLVQACEKWVQEHGIPKVQLMVRNTNEDPIHFYERNGYTVAEVVVLGKSIDADLTGWRTSVDTKTIVRYWSMWKKSLLRR
ncbi:MAG: GNAT family acetyltransferase [Gaiellales bacterium]